jgi:hypothetical protein
MNALEQNSPSVAGHALWLVVSSVHMPIDRLQACIQAGMLLSASTAIKDKPKAKEDEFDDEATWVMYVGRTVVTR